MSSQADISQGCAFHPIKKAVATFRIESNDSRRVSPYYGNILKYTHNTTLVLIEGGLFYSSNPIGHIPHFEIT